MKNYQVFFVSLVIFALIVGIGSKFLVFGIWLLVIGVCGGIFLLGLILILLRKRRALEIGVLLIVIAISFGYSIFLNYQLSIDNWQLPVSLLNESREFEFHCAVVDEPKYKISKLELILGDCEAVDGDKRLPVSGKILMYGLRYSKFNRGDRVAVRGDLSEPQNFTDEFDWKGYLEDRGIHSILYRGEIKKIAERGGATLSLIRFKGAFHSALERTLHEPESSFIRRLILGERQGLEQKVLDDFKRVGAMHLIAISGMHITILSVVLLNILKFFIKRNWALIMLSIFLVFYMMITGMSPSVIRATIMGILAVIAQLSGRMRNSTNVIALAAAIMIAIDPSLMLGDVGFQLSFLATIGIVYFSPYIKKILIFLPNALELRESVAVTLSAQILTIPISIYYFGYISFLSPIATFALALALPYIMIFSFVTGFTSLIFLPLGKVFGIALNVFARLELQLVEFIARIPTAGFEFGEVGAWFPIAFLISAFLFLIWFNSRCQQKSFKY